MSFFFHFTSRFSKDESVIAQRKGMAGPSGMDAESWRPMMLSKYFGKASNILGEDSKNQSKLILHVV